MSRSLRGSYKCERPRAIHSLLFSTRSLFPAPQRSQMGVRNQNRFNQDIESRQTFSFSSLFAGARFQCVSPACLPSASTARAHDIFRLLSRKKLPKQKNSTRCLHYSSRDQGAHAQFVPDALELLVATQAAHFTDLISGFEFPVSPLDPPYFSHPLASVCELTGVLKQGNVNTKISMAY
jgi:hypothetical protein